MSRFQLKPAHEAIHAQELPLLEALSQLSIWAGRYPVARSQREFLVAQTPDSLLDYGSEHPTMRRFFERARLELERRLPRPRLRFGSVIVFRQPGT